MTVRRLLLETLGMSLVVCVVLAWLSGMAWAQGDYVISGICVVSGCLFTYGALLFGCNEFFGERSNL